MSVLAVSGNSLIGGLYLVILFLFCFSAAYAFKVIVLMINNIKYIRSGQGARQKAAEPPQNKPEKIYYIVERKKAPVRRKVSSPPKQIFFTDQN